MTRRTRVLQKLMQIDMTVPLLAGVLVCCIVGFVYGSQAAFRVLLYGFAALFLLGMPLLLIYSRTEELDRFREVRALHGGRLRRGWIPLLSTPSLSFRHQGAPAKLSVDHGSVKYHRPGLVRLQVEWPDEDIELLIHPQGVAAALGSLVGWEDIRIGRSSFDDAYFVRGSDAATIRSMLTRDVQQAVSNLPEQRHFSLAIRRGMLTIQAEYQPGQSLVEFTGTSLVLRDRLHETAVGKQVIRRP